MADGTTFGEFYRATYRGVVAQLYAYTGDLTEAQEATQEAFVRAWTNWRKIGEYEQPRAWVCRVAYRVSVSRWRKTKSALSSMIRHGPPPPTMPEPDGISHDLIAALRKLPEAQRRAVVMHHLSDFPISEIAVVEGVAEGTIKARLSRGRVALARLLADRATDSATDSGTDSGADHPVRAIRANAASRAVRDETGECRHA